MKNLCTWLCALLLLFGLAACEPEMGEDECGGDAACEPEARPDKRRAPTEATPRCSDDIPFEPTYLPEGFGERV